VKVRAVVLDMDGVMIDTEPMYQHAWQRACADLGFTLDDEGYAALVGRPTAECEEDLVTRFGPRFPMSLFRTHWPALWHALAADRGIPCKPGLEALLSLLEERQVPRAVATSSDAEFTAFSLQQAGLAGRVPVVVTGDQVPRGKPAPDIYLEAARRLGQPPAACVAVEDSDAGVRSASAAGMITLCVPDSRPPSPVASQAAFRVLRSLDDVRELIAQSLL
jgi:HAD superfamily hydrolase (TIGR01509 family)